MVLSLLNASTNLWEKDQSESTNQINELGREVEEYDFIVLTNL